MAVKTSSAPLLKTGEFDVKEVKELNFFDLTGEKAKTHGSSAKMYHAELQTNKSGANAQIFTMYGPTGSVQKQEWRHFDDSAKAKKEFDRIIKSKIKKGYKEIDIAQRALGSDEAKSITKAVQLKNASHLKKAKPSVLHQETQRLIRSIMGLTNQFVVQTLKCPLGQLTNQQIDYGRKCLDEAKLIVNKKTSSKKDKEKILELTNEFYGLIPHNLGAGARGKLTNLLLNDLDRIMQKEDDLDTLLDAKSVGAVLKADSAVDEQFKTLNADFSFIDHGDPVFKFISGYFNSSKVRQHGFTRHVVKNIWSIKRKDGEIDDFNSNAEKISVKCKKYNYITEAKNLYDAGRFSLDKRPDLDDKTKRFYKKANVWLCWHGTRSANLVGITKRGLLIRPSGAVRTGAMFGSAKYFAHQSTKSLNYCDGGYWTRNQGKSQAKYMFLLDVALGNMHLASSSHYYRKPPSGCHSVYAKARRSSVLNDEMMTYDSNKQDRQSQIKFLLEIS